MNKELEKDGIAITFESKAFRDDKPKDQNEEEEMIDNENDQEEGENNSDDKEKETQSSKVFKSKLKKVSRKSSLMNFTLVADDLLDKNSELSDAIRELANTLNNTERFNHTAFISKGSSGELLALFKDIITVLNVDFAMGASLNINPTTTITMVKELRESLIDAVASVKGSSEDDYSLIVLATRGLRHILYQLQPQPKGDEAFVSSDDAIKSFPLDTLVKSDDTTSVEHDRDGVGDNGIYPDVAVVQPFLILRPDEKLIKDLMLLGVDPVVLRKVFDGNVYTLPNAIDEESYTTNFNANVGKVAIQDFTTTPLPVEDYGLKPGNTSAYGYSSNLDVYQKMNRAFYDEVAGFMDKMKAKGMEELNNANTAFMHTLILWLNGAFFALYSVNCDIKDIIDRNIKFNISRGLGCNDLDMMLKIFSSFEPGQETTGHITDTIFNLIPNLINDKIRRLLNVYGMPYSKVAYDHVVKNFKVKEYSPTELKDNIYLGYNKVYDYKSKLVVIPRLYLPVNILADPVSIDVEVVVSRAANIITSSGATKKVRLNNMFFNVMKNTRTWINKDRELSHEHYIINLSLFHMVFKDTEQSDFNKVMKAFFYQNYWSKYNDVKSLAAIFGYNIGDNDNHYKLDYYFQPSGLAPTYEKDVIIRKVNARENSNNKYFSRVFPALGNKPLGVNDGSITAQQAPYNLNDFIMGIKNSVACADLDFVMIYYAAALENYVVTELTAASAGSGVDYTSETTLSPTAPAATTLKWSVTFEKLFKTYKDFDNHHKGILSNVDYMLEIPLTTPATSGESVFVNKDDIIRAFRYSTLVSGDHTYYIDNLLTDSRVNKYYPVIDGGKITDSYVLNEQDNLINVTQSNLDSLTSDRFSKDGSLKIYNYQNKSFKLTPIIIKNTDLVAYEVTPAQGAQSTENFSDFLVINKDLGKITLNYNKYCYNVERPAPTTIFFTTQVFTDGNRKGTGNQPNSANHRITMEIIYNALRRLGYVNENNIPGLMTLIQSIAEVRGYHPELANVLYRNTDACNGDEYKVDSNTISEYKSSAKYSSHYPVITTWNLSGLALFAPSGYSRDVLSVTRTRDFYDYFNIKGYNGFVAYTNIIPVKKVRLSLLKVDHGSAATNLYENTAETVTLINNITPTNVLNQLGVTIEFKGPGRK